jgi:hypothetical protein
MKEGLPSSLPTHPEKGCKDEAGNYQGEGYHYQTGWVKRKQFR